MENTQANRPIFGGAMIVIGMSMVGYVDNYVRYIAEEASVWQFHLLRSVVVLSVIWIVARIAGWRITPKNWMAVAVRSGFYGAAMVLYFGSLAFMPIAQAGAGLFSSPIFVLIISVLIFRTPIGKWRILAVLLGFGGVLLILRPDTGGVSAIAGLSVLAGFFYAFGSVTTRSWCSQETTTALIFGFFTALGVFGAAGLIWLEFFPASPALQQNAAFLATGWVPPTQTFMFWMLVQAFGSIFAVACITRGYQSAEVSFVAVFEYFFLISAGFWAYVLFDESIDRVAMYGVLAIVLSGLIITVRSR